MDRLMDGGVYCGQRAWLATDRHKTERRCPCSPARKPWEPRTSGLKGYLREFRIVLSAAAEWRNVPPELGVSTFIVSANVAWCCRLPVLSGSARARSELDFRARAPEDVGLAVAS
jgi:hypothetical protein